MLRWLDCLGLARRRRAEAPPALVQAIRDLQEPVGQPLTLEALGISADH